MVSGRLLVTSAVATAMAWLLFLGQARADTEAPRDPASLAGLDLEVTASGGLSGLVAKTGLADMHPPLRFGLHAGGTFEAVPLHLGLRLGLDAVAYGSFMMGDSTEYYRAQATIELGYDFRLGPVTIRPYGGLGVGSQIAYTHWGDSDWNGNAGAGSGSSIRFAPGPSAAIGVTALAQVSVLLLGVDGRADYFLLDRYSQYIIGGSIVAGVML
jgi:hypothetical protein